MRKMTLAEALRDAMCRHGQLSMVQVEALAVAAVTLQGNPELALEWGRILTERTPS